MAKADYKFPVWHKILIGFLIFSFVIVVAVFILLQKVLKLPKDDLMIVPITKQGLADD